MGVSIYWQPLHGQHLSVGPRSRFVAMLQEAFGAPPWNLSQGDENTLRAMGIAAEDESIREALATLLNAVMQHEQVTVWPVY